MSENPTMCAVCGKPLSDTDTITRHGDGTLTHYYCRPAWQQNKPPT